MVEEQRHDEEAGKAHHSKAPWFPNLEQAPEEETFSWIICSRACLRQVSDSDAGQARRSQLVVQVQVISSLILVDNGLSVELPRGSMYVNDAYFGAQCI